MRNLEPGPVFCVVTPFKEDGSIDFEALEKYINNCADAGANKFYVMAYNSRFSELSWDEIKTLNHFVIKTVKEIDIENFVIVADPLHCSTDVTLEFTQHAEKCGADMISLIFREKFYNNEQVLQHFKFITDDSSLPILIHEMPLISGMGGHTINWPLDLLDSLANFENIKAIKEDAKEDKYSLEVVNTLKDRLSIVISGGGKRQWMQFADMGCQNWLNGIGIFEPKLAINFWNAWQNNDKEYCNSLVSEVESPFFDGLVPKFGFHVSIKAALEAAGHFSRTERLPMFPLTEDEFLEFRKEFEKIEYQKFLKY